MSNDFSTYKYIISADTQIEVKNILHIGWLEKSEPFFNGSVSVDIVEKIKNIILSNYRVNIIRGSYPCTICKQIVYEKIKSNNCLLGCSSILIPNLNGCMYISPDLIIHYIIHHKYVPPLSYIDAIKNLSINTKSDMQKTLNDEIEKSFTEQNIV